MLIMGFNKIAPEISMNAIENSTDEEIVKKVIEDKSFFSLLIDRYESKLKRYLWRLGIDVLNLDDVVQEVFIKVYQNLNDFNFDFKFSSWIYRIAHNTVISYYRKNSNLTKNFSIDSENVVQDHLDFFVSEINLPQEFDRKEVAKVVNEKLMELSSEYREVLVLYYFENKSYKEISDILRKPVNNISVMINRAKKILKTKLWIFNQ